MGQDEVSDLQVARDGGRLVCCLVGVVEQCRVGSPEHENPGARLLAVQGAHMQGRVPAGVAHVHVGAVEKQVFQVLHAPVFTRLVCMCVCVCGGGVRRGRGEKKRGGGVVVRA